MRKTDAAGIIFTTTGTAVSGYSGMATRLPQGKIDAAFGMAAGAMGNIFFTDDSSNGVRKIRISDIISGHAARRIFMEFGAVAFTCRAISTEAYRTIIFAVCLSRPVMEVTKYIPGATFSCTSVF